MSVNLSEVKSSVTAASARQGAENAIRELNAADKELQAQLTSVLEQIEAKKNEGWKSLGCEINLKYQAQLELEKRRFRVRNLWRGDPEAKGGRVKFIITW